MLESRSNRKRNDGLKPKGIPIPSFVGSGQSICLGSFQICPGRTNSAHFFLRVHRHLFGTMTGWLQARIWWPESRYSTASKQNASKDLSNFGGIFARSTY